MTASNLPAESLGLLRKIGTAGAAGLHARSVDPAPLDDLLVHALVRLDRGRAVLTLRGKTALNQSLTGARGPSLTGRAAPPTIRG